MLRSLALTLLFLFNLPFLQATVSPEQVVVVANEDNHDSLRIAQHYMQARGIPPKNLIKLSVSHNEEISWPVFARQIWNPLLQRLARDGWLQGDISTETDAAGRQRIRISENKIGYLVLCRGIPLRISNSPEVQAAETIPNLNPSFAITTASVDSELALLPHPDSHATGVIPNPFLQKTEIPAAQSNSYIRTARLDGPTTKAALALIDNAIVGEQRGLLGRAYVDMGGPHKQGEDWLQATANILKKTGFDVSIETTKNLFDEETRFDAPIFYFGWYSTNIAGRLAAPSFHFPPGAIALHIHSFSARTLRSTTQGWAGPLVEKGATITVGNVAEPYLQVTTIPPLFATGFLQGMQAGEAYAFATPAWSWQSILIGDPLYRPINPKFAEQINKAAEANDPRMAYSILRTINQSPDPEKALTVLNQSVQSYPVLPLCLALAQAQVVQQKPIRLPEKIIISPTEDPGLLVETARFLHQHGRQNLAQTFYRHLVDKVELPPALRKKLQIEAGFIPPDPPAETVTSVTQP